MASHRRRDAHHRPRPRRDVRALVPRVQGTFRYRTSLDPDASGSQLFLYADAATGGTSIDYSAVHLRPTVDGTLVFRSVAAHTPAPPKIAWQTNSPSHYGVHVLDASGPFVLALADAYSTDWQLHGLPKGATAKHIELDGYRNGWAIDAPHGDFQLSLDYAPARWGRYAMHLSQIAAYALVVSLILRMRSSRRRARNRSA